MTRLRKMMLEELERRNYSQGTTRCYLRAVADFAQYFHRSPDQLRPEHVREYQAYLFRERKLQASSVTHQLAALRFFFLKTLKKRWSIEETPYPRKVRRLPIVLSQEEVAQLINSAPNPFYRILLMTLYATGARCAEVARLQVRDIDSQRMVVHIRGGKGREDRDVMLSPVLLQPYASTGVGSSRKCGCSPEAVGIPPASPSATRPSGTLATRRHSVRASRKTSTPTRCATVSPPISTRPVRTCAPSSSC